MKRKTIILGLLVSSVIFASAQKRPIPVYLDDSKPVEQRIEDAISRMTVEEKVAMCHAQAKFSSAGVPRLGIPEIWHSDGPQEYGMKHYGMILPGQNGRTIPVRRFPR